MPTARSTALRSAAVLALLAGAAGCSMPGAGQAAAPPAASAPESSVDPDAAAGAATDSSVSTEEETCARVVEVARTVPQRLGEDPLALLEELTALADTAPVELSADIQGVRDAVDGFRQGERRLTEVVGTVRDLQERCSA